MLFISTNDRRAMSHAKHLMWKTEVVKAKRFALPEWGGSVKLLNEALSQVTKCNQLVRESIAS